MMRFSILLLIAAILAFITSCHCSRKPGTENPTPNIVLIYFDDLGYGDVGAYGATEIETHNIDRLAALVGSQVRSRDGEDLLDAFLAEINPEKLQEMIIFFEEIRGADHKDVQQL